MKSEQLRHIFARFTDKAQINESQAKQQLEEFLILDPNASKVRGIRNSMSNNFRHNGIVEENTLMFFGYSKPGNLASFDLSVEAIKILKEIDPVFWLTANLVFPDNRKGHKAKKMAQKQQFPHRHAPRGPDTFFLEISPFNLPLNLHIVEEKTGDTRRLVLPPMSDKKELVKLLDQYPLIALLDRICRYSLNPATDMNEFPFNGFKYQDTKLFLVEELS